MRMSQADENLVFTKVKDPIVCRLLRKVPKIFKEKGFPSHDRERFSKIFLSLAIPVSSLLSSAWKDNDIRLVQKVSDSFTEGLEFLAGLQWRVDQDLDLIKFWAARLFQHAVGDINDRTGHVELPPSGSIVGLERKDLFLGILKRMIAHQRVLARKGSRKARMFFASLLLSKRGWPEICALKKFDTIKDHQAYLSREATPLDLAFQDAIIHATNIVVGNSIDFEKMNPSKNASFGFPRKMGGAFAEVTQDCPVPEFDLSSVNLYDHQVQCWKAELWKVLKDNMQTAVGTDFEVRVQAIPEPGKLRVITAGNGRLYTFLQPLQGVLLKSWANSQFSTMKDNWIEEVENWHAPRGWVWNSGDYKAATDQLNMNSTLCCYNEILSILGLEDQIPVSGLEGTIVNYSEKDVQNPAGGEPLPRFITQRNGQLMGHPLSFPILCMINLAGLLKSIHDGEDEGILQKGDRRKILSMTKINGDDILFPCPEALCRIWERNAATLGLQLSVGKSYAVSNFAMVNNVMFSMVSEEDFLSSGQKNTRLGYLNQKLILNFSLKTGEASQSPLEIGQAISAMIRDCPEARRFQCDIRRNRNDFPLLVVKNGKEVNYTPNLYIDSRLGGLGVDQRYALGPLRASKVDRLIGRALSEGNLNAYLYLEGLPQKSRYSEILDRLPKPRLDSQKKNLIEYFESRAGGWEEESRDYKSLVGRIMEFESVRDKTSRRVRLEKFARKGLKPLGPKEAFKLHPYFLFPKLPLNSGKNLYSYRRVTKPQDPKSWTLDEEGNLVRLF